MAENIAFRKNDRLKQVGAKIAWNDHRLAEYEKCANDPIYFIENYFKIQDVDVGLIPLILYDFQKEFLLCIHNNRFVSARMARQMGKSTVVAAYICWYIIFDTDRKVGIISKDKGGSKDVLERVKMGYEYLPLWLQQGIIKWDVESIKLENRSTVLAAATTSSSIRGKSLSLCYIDEVAFIENNTWAPFYKSTYPVISSGDHSKVVMTSTPDGMNHFYYIHTAAMRSEEEGGSEFVAIDVPWDKHPKRDQKWKELTIRNTDEESFRQEFEIEFVGSSKTLIKPLALQHLRSIRPIVEFPSLKVFTNPIKGHSYLVTVDVSRGLKKDFSVFTIIDITDPDKHYEVATYRNNEINHYAFPDVIVDYAMQYNEAEILVELNDLGEAVAELIYNQHDYENLVVTQVGKQQPRLGVMVSKTTKTKGCQTLKSLIESQCLQINNAETIGELNTFVEKGVTFQAEEGFHDDIVMSLVNYAWYIDSPFFQPDYDYNISKELSEHNKNYTENDLDVPLVLIDDGLDDAPEYGALSSTAMAGFRS
ncbi:MAG: terminase family protein [Candidatus Izemoplasma sp.]